MSELEYPMTDRYTEAFTRALEQPIPVYRVVHDVLHCQMGLHLSLAEAATDRWRHLRAGLPVSIVPGWLDLRPAQAPSDPPPPSRRRRRRLRVVRSAGTRPLKPPCG
jgi:hypothetical protein